ncbi:MAG TPA: zf-HC2 domain-containing protein [Candidatus Acidoferrales bacterium]
MNCKGVIRELSNYIDGALDPLISQEIERHLGHCDDCKMLVDQTRKTIEIFCGSKRMSLPGDVRSRIHAALKAKMSEKPN